MMPIQDGIEDMLRFLDIFYTILHLLIIGFNLVGWIWPRTRKLHLIVLSATAASWFILGIWYGWGYCPVTDWQWDVKEKLGETNLPASFIKYFADKITGEDFSASMVEKVTLISFILIIVLTIYVKFVAKNRGTSKARKQLITRKQSFFCRMTSSNH